LILHNYVTDETVKGVKEVIQEETRTNIEPSAAVPVAAIFEKKVYSSGKNVGIIISGGNVDLANTLT